MNNTMKIRYVCGFFVGAILLGLLLMFFIKPSFLLSGSDVSEKNNIVQEQQSTNLIQDNGQLKDSEKKGRYCDQVCVLDVIERIKTNQNLKNEYGPSMQDYEALATAQYLKDKPELITEIEESLAAITSQSERDSVVLVFNHLPVDQTVEISKRLIESGYRKAQIDGIIMLYEASKKGAEVKQPIETLIKDDKDVRVVIEAIKTLHRMHPDGPQNIARERLNQILSDPKGDDRDQARALITKVQLFTTNGSIKQDIINALKSKSRRIQAKGIQALDYVLHEQHEGSDDSTGDWSDDSDVVAAVDSIANNEEVDPRNRREATDLIKRYSSN